MADTDNFLRWALPGNDVLAELAPHFRLIGHFVPPSCMPHAIKADGSDHVLLEFTEWIALVSFFDKIAEYAIDVPEMIPALTGGVNWQVNVHLKLNSGPDLVSEPFTIRPELRLDRAAVITLALVFAFENWFSPGEDRSLLIPAREVTTKRRRAPGPVRAAIARRRASELGRGTASEVEPPT